MKNENNNRFLSSIGTQLSAAVIAYNALYNMKGATAKISYDASLKLAVACEKLAVDCRGNMLRFPYSNKLIMQQYDSNLMDIARVSCDMTEQGWFQMTMPFLPVRKDHGNNDYIAKILYPALDWFFNEKTEMKYTRCFDKAYIIIRFIFDESRGPEAPLIDLDNFETNFIRDLLVTRMLPTDNPNHVWTMELSGRGSEPRTEVYVVDRADIRKWFDWLDTLDDRAAEVAPDKFCVIPSVDATQCIRFPDIASAECRKGTNILMFPNES